MPRGARLPTPGRPQTLREARRAYQKAGRTPSLTAAQIRAAERSVEADKRAAEIQAKEKRAKETKRKKEEQEAKQRKELRKLVQLGKLPEESLWGKVRASQPRLHTFFGTRQHTKVAILKEEEAIHDEPGKENAEALSQKDVHEGLRDDEQLPSSAPPALKTQRISSPPVSSTLTEARNYERNAPSKAIGLNEQVVPDVASESPAQRDAQLSFTGTQLFFALDDDLDLEAELNGHSEHAQDAPTSSRATGNRVPDTQSAQSNKRKTGMPAPKTTPPAKIARHALSEISGNQRIGVSAKPYTATLKSRKSKSNNGDKQGQFCEMPTASQVQALFGTEDFEADDRENLDLLRRSSEPVRSQYKKLEVASPPGEELSPGCFASRQSAVKHISAGGVIHSEHDHNDTVHITEDNSLDGFADEFGDDLDDEIFQIASHSFEASRDAAQLPPRIIQPDALTARPQNNPTQHASPSKSNPYHTRNLSSIQTSSYDLDGLNDEDLAGLADVFNSSQHLNQNKVSPAKFTSSRPKSGRTIPWATSTTTQPVGRQDDVDPGFPDKDEDEDQDECGSSLYEFKPRKIAAND